VTPSLALVAAVVVTVAVSAHRSQTRLPPAKPKDLKNDQLYFVRPVNQLADAVAAFVVMLTPSLLPRRACIVEATHAF
jgi:hypothetical protein